eukprot:COSAG02_NODE_4721_length_5052_cov_14.669695_7_plen_141_part_00
MIAHIHEKAGLIDDALEWAEKVATREDVTQGGNSSILVRMRGLRLQGRCMALKGQASEAEAALASAAEQYAAVGWWLGEVHALRDLLVYVLRNADREAEGMSRLKAAIVRLLGPTPPETELDVLATSLGEAVDLAAVMGG